MKLFRKKNIEQIIQAIKEDEYDDQSQSVQRKELSIAPSVAQPILHQFLSTYLAGGTVLEVGCGCGDLFKDYHITHAVEPSFTRLTLAQAPADTYDVILEQAVAEYLPYSKGFFDTIFMVGGFHQVRSDYEALIEFNRVLKKGGRLILDVFNNDEADSILGRSYGVRHFVRTVMNFGFTVYALIHDNEPTPPRTVKPGAYICFEKDREFNYKELNQLQIIPPDSKEYWQVRNFFPEGRDWKLI